ncbi:MAG: hypothetical protein NXI00_10940 [Cytophagales bacterium]|nr:hypothetical protein [Cytophagales bacterium]
MSNNTKSAAGSTVAKTETSATPTKAEKAIKIKTVSDVLDALRETNSKVSFYNSFVQRFEHVKDFKNNLDGSALTLVIANEDGERIEFKNLQMITKFIDEALVIGEDQKDKMEKELLEMTL